MFHGRGEPLSVYGFQVITALPEVVDNSVGSFPCGAKLSLGRIFCCCGDFVQDEVSYIESSEFYSLIVVFGHLLLVLCHFVGSFVSYFVQAIQFKPQLVVITLLAECLSFDASYPYLDRDHCFSYIGEFEGGFSRWGPCCGPVSPKDVGQFSWPSALRVIHLGFDNLE